MKPAMGIGIHCSDFLEESKMEHLLDNQFSQKAFSMEGFSILSSLGN
jgi:hypothetical protein